MRKIIALLTVIVILAVTVINCSAQRITSQNYTSYENGIDENGKIKPGYGGQYWYCTKEGKYFTFDNNVCPYCGEQAKPSDGEVSDKVFDNASLLIIKYCVKCPSCCATPMAFKKNQLLSETNAIWTKGYLNCPQCGTSCTGEGNSYVQADWIFCSVAITDMDFCEYEKILTDENFNADMYSPGKDISEESDDEDNAGGTSWFWQFFALIINTVKQIGSTIKKWLFV